MRAAGEVEVGRAVVQRQCAVHGDVFVRARALQHQIAAIQVQVINADGVVGVNRALIQVQRGAVPHRDVRPSEQVEVHAAGGHVHHRVVLKHEVVVDVQCVAVCRADIQRPAIADGQRFGRRAEVDRAVVHASRSGVFVRHQRAVLRDVCGDIVARRAAVAREEQLAAGELGGPRAAERRRIHEHQFARVRFKRRTSQAGVTDVVEHEVTRAGLGKGHAGTAAVDQTEVRGDGRAVADADLRRAGRDGRAGERHRWRATQGQYAVVQRQCAEVGGSIRHGVQFRALIHANRRGQSVDGSDDSPRGAPPASLSRIAGVDVAPTNSGNIDLVSHAIATAIFTEAERYFILLPLRQSEAAISTAETAFVAHFVRGENIVLIDVHIHAVSVVRPIGVEFVVTGGWCRERGRPQHFEFVGIRQ